MIQGRLGRESTIFDKSTKTYIKDFSYLGRPLKEVIYLDFTDDTVPMHKDNCLVLPQWKGDPDDRELIDLVPFLESMAQKQGVDLREEMRRYGRENTSKTFNQMQAHRRDMIMKQRDRGVGGFMQSVGKLNQDNKSYGSDFNSSFSK